MAGRALRRALLGVTVAAVLGGTAGCSRAPAPDAGNSAQPVVVDDARVNQARYDCLVEQGFAVTRDADGAVRFTDPDDSRTSAFETADRACTQDLVAQGLLVGQSTDRLRAQYAALVSVHQCMDAAGFPVSPLPSQEVFVEGGGAFNVADGSAPISVADARAACTSQFEALEAAS